MNTRAMTKKDIPIIAKMMSKAFESDPLYDYFVPDKAKKAIFIEEFMTFRLKFSLKYGIVTVTEDLSGVVVTIPPNAKLTQLHVLLMGGVKAILRAGKLTSSRLIEFENFADENLTRYLGNADKYYHIGPLAVSPEMQGKGIGKELFLHEIERVKASGAPCFIETQTEKNKQLYEKYGFETISADTAKEATFTNYLMTLK